MMKGLIHMSVRYHMEQDPQFGFPPWSRTFSPISSGVLQSTARLIWFHLTSVSARNPL